MEHVKDSKGFTLLLAALIASIVLALGTSIFGLVQKELILSSAGRDSQYAFYAADTAAECALYWDVRYRYFSIDPPLDSVPLTQCGAQTICDDPDDSCDYTGVYPQTMSFRFEPNGLCADVSITKSEDAGTGAISTVIHADGYSRACDSLSDSNRVLQRSVELHY